MTTAKIAITVPIDVLSRARAAVRGGRSPSLSAYVSAALDQKLMHDDLDALLNEMLEESGGPLTKDELEQANAVLDGSARPRKSKARARAKR